MKQKSKFITGCFLKSAGAKLTGVKAPRYDRRNIKTFARSAGDGCEINKFVPG